MTQSRRFEIGSLLFAALEAAPDLSGVRCKRNPPNPASLRDGERVLFMEDVFDGYIDDKGQQGQRRYRFTVGVINRSDTDADAKADADEVAAALALLQASYQLVQTHNAEPVREVQTEFKVEGVDVGGALVLTTFEIQYRRAKPPRG